MGRFADVDALAERACRRHPGLLRYTSGFGQTTALLMAGELDGAGLAQHSSISRGGTAGSRDRQAVGGRRTDRTRGCAAAVTCAGAAAALAQTGYSWGPLAWMLLAQALGQLGETGRGGKELVERRIPARIEVDAVRARSCRWRGRGRRRRGVTRRSAVGGARRGRAAERGGQSAVALRALLERCASVTPARSTGSAAERRRLRVRQAGDAARPDTRRGRHSGSGTRWRRLSPTSASTGVRPPTRRPRRRISALPVNSARWCHIPSWNVV